MDCSNCNAHYTFCEGCEIESVIKAREHVTNGKSHIDIDELREKFFKQETNIHNGEKVIAYRVFDFIRKELGRLWL